MSGNNITETGPLNFRQLQEQNNEHQTHGSNDLLNPELVKRLEEGVNNLGSHSAYNIEDTIPYYEDSDVKQTDYDQNRGWWDADRSDYFGKSFWDNPEEVVYGDDINAAERRAQNQWAIAKLGAGITKCLGTAVTTFLQGTAGLLYGTAETMAATGDENQSWAQTFSHIFNNEVTNGLSEFNESMDIWLPNYRTQEEKDNAWTQNLGTMNFWSDNVIKNLGFTIGAVASGKALVGILDKAIKLGPVGVRLAGSLFGAASEASFEANNLYRDYTKAQYEKAAHHFGVDVHLIEEDERFDALRKDIDERASRAGIIDMVANIALLTAGDYAVFGKLFTKGISSAEKAVTQSEVSKRISQKAYDVAKGLIGNYDAKIKGTKGAIKKTFGDMITEGHEELAQNFISSFSGAMYDPDSPDTYYKIGKDKTYTVEANNVLDGMTKAIGESYLNFDKWEEFFAGSMTALLGVPTFGKASNASSATWLGKNKTIGISGGLLGNIAETKEVDEEANKEVASLNGIIDKLNKQSHFFAHNMSYTDKMNRFRAAGNKFEYKNNEDNSDFEAFDIFAQFNRLDDLKRIVDQDIESLKESDIVAITAGNTHINQQTGTSEEWKNKAGQPILKRDDKNNAYIGKDDFEYVKEELKKKQQSIKQKIDDYEQARKDVRDYPVTQNFTEQNQQELTWLRWKKMQFENRIYDMAVEGKSSFQRLASWLSNGIEEMNKEMDEINSVLDTAVTTTDEDGKKTKHLTDKEKNRTKRLGQLKESVKNGNKVLEVLNKLVEITSNPNKSKEEIASELERLKNKNGRFLQDLVSQKNKNDYDAFALEKVDDQIAKQINLLAEDIHKALDLRGNFIERFRDFVSNSGKINEKRKEEEKKEEKRQEESKQAAAATASDSGLKPASAEMNKKVNDLLNSTKGAIDILDNIEDIFERVENGEDIAKVTNGLVKSIQVGGMPKEEQDVAKSIVVEQVKKAVANNADISSDEILNSIDDVDLIPQNVKDDLLKKHNGDIEAVHKEMQQILSNAASFLKDALDDINENEAAELSGLTPEELQNKKKIESFTLSDQKDENLLDQSNNQTKDENLINPETDVPPVPAVSNANQQQDKKKKVEEEEKKENRLKDEIERKAAITVKYFLRDDVYNKFFDNDTLKPDDGSLEYKHIKDFFDWLKGMYYAIPKQVKEHKDLDPQVFAREVVNQEEVKKAIDYCNSILHVWLDNDITPENLAPLIENVTISIQNFETYYQPTEGDNGNLSLSEEEATSSETYMNPQEPEDKDYSSNDDAQVLGKQKNNTSGFWWSSTSEVFTYADKDEYSVEDFDKIVEKKYPENAKRIIAVHNYLLAHNAFKNAFNVKKGEQIYFGTDLALNEKAGETVILMYDKDGHVLGDLISPNSNFREEPKGLRDFYNKFQEELNNATISGSTYMSKQTSTVSQKMVGKMPYSKTKRPLREIFKEKDSSGNDKVLPVQFAIFNGVNFVGVSDEMNDKIMTPLHAESGWVYVLMPTGSTDEKEYFPIPISIDRFNSSSETGLAKDVKSLFTSYAGQFTSHNNLMAFKNGLQSLLALKEVHVNVENGNLKITVKQYGNSSQITICDCPVNEYNPDEIMDKLNGTPFQISAKKLTNSRTSRFYRDKVMEVASCSLIEGRTYPLNSWFVIDPIVDGQQQKATKVESVQRGSIESRKETTTTTVQSAERADVYTYNNITGELFKNAEKLDLDGDLTSSDKKTYAMLYCKSNSLSGEVQTRFGVFNTDTLKFAGENEKVGTVTIEVVDEDEQQNLIQEGQNLVNESESLIQEIVNPEPESSDEQQEAPVEEVSDDTTSESDNSRKELLQKYYDFLERFSDKEDAKEMLEGQSTEVLNNSLEMLKLRSQNKKKICKILDAVLKENSTNYRIADNLDAQKIDLEKELKWLSKALPQLSHDECLRIIDRVQAMTDKGVEFWGKFQNGVMIISKDAAEGTVYHEAFHAVMDLLNDNERKELLSAASQKYGNKHPLILEEQLAEDFRKYVQLEETSFVGKVVKLFRTLKNLIFGISGLNQRIYIDNLFYRISRAKFSDRTIPQHWSTTWKDSLEASKKREKDIIDKINQDEAQLRQAQIESLFIENVSEETKEYLAQRKITSEEWNNLSPEIKNVLIKCKS